MCVFSSSSKMIKSSFVCLFFFLFFLGVVKEEEVYVMTGKLENKWASFFIFSFQCYRLLQVGGYFLSSVVCLDLKRRRRHFLVICFCFVISNNVKKKERKRTFRDWNDLRPLTHWNGRALRTHKNTSRGNVTRRFERPISFVLLSLIYTSSRSL